jgi:hypothetical protein
MQVERSVGSAPTIIAITAEDDRFATTRRAATELAKEQGADLILYDWDAAEFMSEPLPGQWSGDVEGSIMDRLDEPALEAAGRHAIAEQVGVAREAGVGTTAWLPSTHDPADLRDYARDHRAITIVVPADLLDDDALATLADVGDDSTTDAGSTRGAPEIHIVPA